jgi:hypothetical protein
MRWEAIFAGAAILLVAAPAASAGVYRFRSPTGNIRCVSIGARVACAVKSVYRYPDATRGAAYGNWVLDSGGRAVFTWLPARSLPSPNSHVLRYGHTWQAGGELSDGVRCTSRFTGMTCRNVERHGFSLSRERQRIF